MDLPRPKPVERELTDEQKAILEEHKRKREEEKKVWRGGGASKLFCQLVMHNI